MDNYPPGFTGHTEENPLKPTLIILLSNLVYGYHEWANKKAKMRKHKGEPDDDPLTYLNKDSTLETLLKIFNPKAVLSLPDLQRICDKRSIEAYGLGLDTPLSYFGMAMMGEGGEFCNLLAKIERRTLGAVDAGNSIKVEDITKAKLEEEIGGLVIYLSILAQRLDISVEDAVIRTFNEKSVKLNYPVMLTKKTPMFKEKPYIHEDGRMPALVGSINNTVKFSSTKEEELADANEELAKDDIEKTVLRKEVENLNQIVKWIANYPGPADEGEAFTHLYDFVAKCKDTIAKNGAHVAHLEKLDNIELITLRKEVERLNEIILSLNQKHIEFTGSPIFRIYKDSDDDEEQCSILGEVVSREEYNKWPGRKEIMATKHTFNKPENKGTNF